MGSEMSGMLEIIAADDQLLLRFNIDGEWSAEQFSGLLADVSFIVAVWVAIHGLDGGEAKPLSPLVVRLVEEAENAKDALLAADIERQGLSQSFKLRPPFSDDDVWTILTENPDMG